MKKIILLLFVFLGISVYAQVGFGTTTPNAALEIASSNDGFLMPRVALTSKDNPKPLTMPTVSEIVYNTATDGTAPNDVKPGFYFWTGTSWLELQNSSGTYWTCTGNAGTKADMHFIGTTDDVDFNFRRNNLKAGNLGVANTSFGVNALSENKDEGVGNSALGVNALASNTTATRNSAVGYGALQHNAGAGNIDNTALGFEALHLNNSAVATEAKNNSAVGARALRANTTGYNNTAVGLNSLTSNTSGVYNTAVGVETLAANINGSSNAALGAEALKQNTTGSYNTATGSNSLAKNTTGSHNTATGSNSLAENTIGNNNVALGYDAMLNNTTGSENTAVGRSALKNATNSENTAIGFDAMSNVTTGSGNVAVGHKALSLLTTGSNNIGIGTGVELPCAASNQVRIGNTAITYAGVQVSWTITSDRRWKSDIKNSDLGLDFIKDLHPVSYVRKNDESKKLEYGFIAQELEQTLDKFGATHTGIVSKADDGMLSVRYNDLLAPMVKAIQEQQVLIEELTIRMEKLEKDEK
jgi:hypothetical protein